MNLKLSIVNYQLSILLLLFFALPLKAQVTIGAQQAPHSYSLLELTAAQKAGGLRLPMLSNDERDALNLTSDSTEASGLFIYNTDINCVEFWSGGKWIDLCNNTAPAFTANNSITLTSGTNIQTVCSGAGIIPIQYSTTGATGATITGLPPGVVSAWGISSGGNGGITINGAPTASGNYTYVIILTGGSGTGVAIGTITVNQVLSAISGANGVTKGATDLTYSVTPVSGVTTYTWTVPADWSITAGQGTASITVTSGTTEGHAGAITVTANNGNCTGTSTLAVSVGCPVKTLGGGWLTFMCYNLGAADAVKSLTPAQQANYTPITDEYGDYYQWGRVADGHQLSTSDAILGPVTTFDSKGQAIGDTIGKFIMSSTGDWRSPQNNNLWSNDGKGVADPCPAGWRVPTRSEWLRIGNGDENAIYSGNTSISGNRWDWATNRGYTNGGFLVTPPNSSTPALFLPACGLRYYINFQILSPSSSGANYWSSSVLGTNLAYDMGFTNPDLHLGQNTNRGNGCNVRCIVE